MLLVAMEEQPDLRSALHMYFVQVAFSFYYKKYNVFLHAPDNTIHPRKKMPPRTRMGSSIVPIEEPSENKYFWFQVESFH